MVIEKLKFFIGKSIKVTLTTRVVNLNNNVRKGKRRNALIKDVKLNFSDGMVASIQVDLKKNRNTANTVVLCDLLTKNTNLEA